MPLLCKPTKLEAASSQTMYLVARGIAPGFGQNKTGGYHERIIPFRRKTFEVFGKPAAAKELGDMARERIEEIGRVQAILKKAIATFACHGNAQKTKELQLPRNRNDPLRGRVDELASRVDEHIDRRFFEHLQDEFEASGTNERESTRRGWLRNFVIPSAASVLTLAHQSLPTRQNDFYHAHASSQNLFDRSVRAAFPTLKEDENGS